MSCPGYMECLEERLWYSGRSIDSSCNDSAPSITTELVSKSPKWCLLDDDKVLFFACTRPVPLYCLCKSMQRLIHEISGTGKKKAKQYARKTSRSRRGDAQHGGLPVMDANFLPMPLVRQSIPFVHQGGDSEKTRNRSEIFTVKAQFVGRIAGHIGPDGFRGQEETFCTAFLPSSDLFRGPKGLETIVNIP
ncbi:hypothetical protein PoB_002067800 [Plakobranchus ocellatus]|uniref:Uncharacterized protein n=1 Tax=Plakobranchus ocellatus TaxID=259542 RepID=A0AAV3ZH96_9GAST|nr:hypothetical protein PoB_002067800 [Plakobranchus ocellatus]